MPQTIGARPAKHNRAFTAFSSTMSARAVLQEPYAAEEQGRGAARTALRILDGESPGDIPVVENREVRLMVNLDLARAIDIVVPLSVLRTAAVFSKTEE